MSTPRPRYQKHRDTSRAGAEAAELTLPASCRAVLNVIRANDGATIAEIARWLDWDKSTVSARVSQLRDDMELIVDSGERRRSTSRVRGIIWRARREPQTTLAL